MSVPLHEAQWEVEIDTTYKMEYFFSAVTMDNVGLDGDSLVGEDFTTSDEARNAWKEFAEQNDIKNWEFIHD